MTNTKCPITTLEQRQDVLLGVGASGKLYFFIKNGQYKLTEDEFFACIDQELLFEPRIGFKIKTENVKKPKQTTTEVSFYSEPIQKPNLSLKIEPIMYQAPKDIVKPPEDASILSTNELFVGGTAILALAMSAMQQIKKKKEQLEQQKCCSDSKISINKLETDIKELQAKEKESSKTLHAEIYEQYKEIKELRDDSQEVKEILSKVIDKLK